MGDDEVQVRAAAERLVAAFGSGRLDDYFACFADDATFVFYTTPQRLESVDAYRQLWDRWVRDDGFRVRLRLFRRPGSGARRRGGNGSRRCHRRGNTRRCREFA